MPITVAPDVIEQSDFSYGIDLQGSDPSVDTTALLDDLNLILDPNTGSLVTRGGFQLDWTLNGISALASHYVLQIFPFQAPGGSKLVVIVSDGSSGADNVGLILVDLEANSWLRMDTPGVTWTNPTEHHWGVGMDGIWYGGTQGAEMYSFTVTGSVWNDSAGIPDSKELVDDVNDSVNVVTEYARDFAFKGKEIVEYDGDYYRPSRNIRFDEYDNDEKWYSVGDKVSRQWIWGSTSLYWKSFKCIKKHDPTTTADTEPGTGADWREYWTKVRLPFPKNDDSGESETSNGWVYVPVASETHIAAWHGSRMFLRFDDEKDRSRLQFSAPIKPDKGEDVPDVTWTPDFAPSATNEGQGGGWLAFNDGTHHGFITALRSYGDRLLVFKRQAVWSLVGTDDTTWEPKRIIEGIGCVGPDSHVELDGIVYFLSDEGLYMTDGQEAREAPGNERVRDFIRDRLDESQFVQSTEVRRVDQYPTMWKWDGFIWVSMPSVETTAAKSVTLVYHAPTASWYYTNLPVRDTATYRDAGRTHLALALSPFYGEQDDSGHYPTIYQYKKSLTSDNNGNISSAAADIAWRVRCGWWSFATLRQQRRIRRVWALAKLGAAQTVSIVARKDYSDTAVATTTRAAVTSVVQHLEGQVFADAHAISMEVSGTKAPATIFGVAVHTQRRRDMRYHSGPGVV